MGPLLQVCVAPVHTPAAHTSPAVQGSPSSQSALSALATSAHVPVWGAQLLVLQAVFPAPLHVTTVFGSTTHAYRLLLSPMQASVPLQRLPSSWTWQALPPSAGLHGQTQAPAQVPCLQTSFVVHARLSSQGVVDAAGVGVHVPVAGTQLLLRHVVSLLASHATGVPALTAQARIPVLSTAQTNAPRHDRASELDSWDCVDELVAEEDYSQEWGEAASR